MQAHLKGVPDSDLPQRRHQEHSCHRQGWETTAAAQGAAAPLDGTVMIRKIKVLVITAVFALALVVGWRVGSCEMKNIELQDDLHDLASQSSFRFGNSPGRSDDDFRDAVIRRAKDYGIELNSSQVTVQRPESGTTMYLAADYSVPVNLPRFSFVLHFTPSSTKNIF